MLEDETVVTLAEAASLMPALLIIRKGRKSLRRKPHVSTIWRWARQGVNGHRLEVRRLGRRFVTSMKAIERFTTALAQEELPERPAPSKSAPPPRSRSVREHAVAEARERLRRAGI